MTTLTQSISELRGSIGRGFNWRLFLEDNFTGTWYRFVAVVVLALVTGFFGYGQFQELPVLTVVVLIAWLLGILMVSVGELRLKHTGLSRWLKENLLSSVSNTLLTLFLVLLIISAFSGLWQWGVVNASFDPDQTAPDVRPENGATWGVLIGARKLLLTGLLPPELSWRVWLALGFIGAMWLLTFVSGRPSLKERLRPVRNVTNVLWLFSPVILFVFLSGVSKTSYSVSAVLIGAVVLLAAYALLWWQRVIKFNWLSLAGAAALWPLFYSIWWGIGQSEAFEPINVDLWGGLLLTLIIASSVIILSLPLGMVLALGRRSDVYGIPAWIMWPVSVVATVYFLATSTPDLWATAQNFTHQIIALWPLLIPVVVYLIHRLFRNNIVAGASTTFIELIRSVPLITLLFMGINMGPFFFKTGTEVAKPWAVIVAYTLFSSAYMAETIRGGLQAIPNGQYEAADALGFNTLQKMRFIILPQALRIVIPAIVGQFIGAYKSSSLVSVVGLFDFLGINRSILSNERWFGLRTELYVFMALVYFLGSFIMSSYSRRLEARLGVGER